MTKQKLYNEVANLINHTGDLEAVSSLIKAQIDELPYSIKPIYYIAFIIDRLNDKRQSGLDANGQNNNIFNDGEVFIELTELKSKYKLSNTDINAKDCREDLLEECWRCLIFHEEIFNLQNEIDADRQTANKTIPDAINSDMIFALILDCIYITPLYKCIISYIYKNNNQSNANEIKLINDIHDIAKKLQLYSSKVDTKLSLSYGAICANYRRLHKYDNLQDKSTNNCQGQQNTDICLPSELDTDRARKYFARAIEVGYMTPTDTGYKWLHNHCNLSSLGYFVERCYCSNNTERLKVKALELLFSVERLGKAIYQMHDGNQKWKSEMDKKIFF
jgi:hypothetical protein